MAGALAGAAPQALGETTDWLSLALFLFSAVCLHAAGNLFNDRDDFLCGVDRAGKSGAGSVASGERTPGEAARAAWAFLAAAAVSGGALLLRTGRLRLAAAGLAGALGGWLYAKGRHSPKHRACGELWIFLVFGLALPAAARWAVAGSGAPLAVLNAIPVSLWTVLLLYANNWRDRETDAAAGVRTLAGALHDRFGGTGVAAAAWAILLAAAVLPAAALSGAGPLPRATGLSLPVFAAAACLLVRFRRGQWGRAPLQTLSALELVFAVPYLAALWLSPLAGNP
jgi:1,4-dihydroxy-2-naphthoate octaprenyltransferase